MEGMKIMTHVQSNLFLEYHVIHIYEQNEMKT